MKFQRLVLCCLALIMVLTGVSCAEEVTANRIGALKQLDDGTPVALTNKALHFVNGVTGYIEELDRSAGMLVMELPNINPGVTVSISGTMQTDTSGERYISVTDCTPDGTADVAPVGANNRALKMPIMNGLKVRAWGTVKSILIGGYIISDGSDANGIKVIDDYPVNMGEFVSVTGAAGFDGDRFITTLPKSSPLPDGPLVFKWDPTQFNNGQHVFELQLMRDMDLFGDFLPPVRAIRDRTLWELGRTDMSQWFSTNQPHTVTYYSMDMGSLTPTFMQYTWPAEPYGITHWYQFRVLLAEPSTDGIFKYRFATLGNPFIATAVQPVLNDGSCVVYPGHGDTLFVYDLYDGMANFSWYYAAGADQYRVMVEPVQPGMGPTWMSSIIYYGCGDEIGLPDPDRLALASVLSHPMYAGKQMKWRVDGRHTGDTNPAWTIGEWVVFTIGDYPPPPPPF